MLAPTTPRFVPVPAPAGAPAPASFDEIYSETSGLVRHIVFKWYGIRGADADDLVQEVFLNFFRRQKSIGNARAWLVAAACNIGKRYYRDHREVPASDEFLTGLLEQEPEDVADRIGRAVDARQTIAQLPEKCRVALKAFYNEGRTYREMSKIWNTSEDVLRNLVYRCVRKAVEVFAGKGKEHDAS
jgi:RNA polymerase sigma factor (sigma-70 family)